MHRILSIFLVLISLQSFAEAPRWSSWYSFDMNDFSTFVFDPPLTSQELNYMSGIGYVLDLTDKKLNSGYVSLSFSYAEGREGVALHHSLTGFNNDESYYTIGVGPNSNFTISVPDDCTIDTIIFSGYMANVLKIDTEPGLYNLALKTWYSNGEKVSKVTFHNGASYSTAINKIRVKSSRPATPLLLQSSTPSTGEQVNFFQSMILRFNTPIKDTLTTSGIHFASFGQSPQVPKISYNGNIVTLKLVEPIKSSGPYTLKVPAGCFVNEEGSENNEISVKFLARIPLVYDSVSPSTDNSYRTLNDTIILTYPSNVIIAKDAMGMLFHDDVNMGSVQISQATTPSKEIILKLMNGEITKEGTWTVYIPEGAIHNTYYREGSGTVSDYDSWNEDFSLTYTVKIPVLPEMIAAKELITAEGIGYPTKESVSRMALEEIIAKGEEATAEELTVAMGAFYNETDIELPADSLWYHIVGVNNAENPSRVYLTFVNDSVRLIKDESQASPFQAIAKDDGKFLFRTPDKKHFLHVLTNREDLFKMSAANVTDEETVSNNLVLSKLSIAGVDSTLTFGKMSITGVLRWQVKDDNDYYNEVRDSMSMAIDHPATMIVDCEKDILYFDEQLSSAFVFEAAEEPFDPSLYVYPSSIVTSKSTIMEGESLTISIKNVKTASLVKPENPYFEQNGKRIEFEGVALTETAAPTEFIVNTKSLSVGTYTLVMPLGTFAYEKLEKDVLDAEMRVNFAIKEYVEPEPDFQYTYNNRFVFLQDMLRSQHNISIVADTDLNDFVLYTNIGHPYSGMIPDSRKVVEVKNFYNSNLVYAKGHLYPYPEITEDYGLEDVQAVKLVLDKPIEYGDIGIATVAYVIPRGSFGDANFGQWLQDPNSIAPEECIVNDTIDYITVLVNNDLAAQGIRNITTKAADDSCYDLQGRKVTNTTKPGVYVVNGQKRVVK